MLLEETLQRRRAQILSLVLPEVIEQRAEEQAGDIAGTRVEPELLALRAQLQLGEEPLRLALCSAGGIRLHGLLPLLSGAVDPLNHPASVGAVHDRAHAPPPSGRLRATLLQCDNGTSADDELTSRE